MAIQPDDTLGDLFGVVPRAVFLAAIRGYRDRGKVECCHSVSLASTEQGAQELMCNGRSGFTFKAAYALTWHKPLQ